jgi:hypothetical protein
MHGDAGIGLEALSPPGAAGDAGVSPAVILRREENKDAAIRRIKAIKPDEENPLAVWIGPYKKIRTLEANALYWREVGIISKATNHSKIALHEYFKRLVFGVEIIEVDGKAVEYTASSARASRGDFSELIDTVREFRMEHNIEEAA